MKKTICVILLALSVFIMLSGVTMSYFNSGKETEIPFTTGIFKVVIENLTSDAEISEPWFPGRENAKKVEWIFRNTGDQPAWLRIKIDGKWDPEHLEDRAVWELSNNDWYMYGDYYYCKFPVPPGETAGISFYVWLDMDLLNMDESYNSAIYNILLTMEASQKKWDFIY